MEKQFIILYYIILYIKFLKIISNIHHILIQYVNSIFNLYNSEMDLALLLAILRINFYHLRINVDHSILYNR